MAQHKSPGFGTARAINGSDVILGSWSATTSDSDPVTQDEDIVFENPLGSPTGATGKVLSLSSGVFKFYVDSGAIIPVATDIAVCQSSSAQIGLTTVIAESQFLSASPAIIPGTDIFNIESSNTWYDIASIDFEHQLTLVSNFSGVSGTGKNYAITRDFTSSLNLAFPNPGDILLASLLKRTINDIDAIYSNLVWNPMSLSGGWSNKAGLQGAEYSVDAFNVVRLRGTIENGSATDPSVFETFPSGSNLRPAATLIFPNSLTKLILISSDGNLTYSGPTGLQTLYLSGINYEGSL